MILDERKRHGPSACIFCFGDAAGAPVEHAISESLGGGDAFIVPEGLVCAKCNQYFGSKVEQPALRTFPFDCFRFYYGFPSKKGRPIEITTPALILRPGSRPGVFEAVGRTPEMHRKLLKGEITQFTTLGSIVQPETVCRLLLKSGLELLATDGSVDVRSKTFDLAREFARAPRPGSSWWFYMALDSGRMFSRFVPTPNSTASSATVAARSFKDEEEDKWVMSAMFSEDILFQCPLEPDVQPEDPPTAKSIPYTTLHRAQF